MEEGCRICSYFDDNSTWLFNYRFQVFSLINALVVDQPDQPKDISAHSEFSDEQNLVGKLVHLVYNDDPEVHYKVECITYKHNFFCQSFIFWNLRAFKNV